MAIKTFKCEKWEQTLSDWTQDKKLNPLVTETAGFIPLEVQIQKFIQSGQRAKYRSDMFDSVDYYDMYMHPDVRVNRDDDIETINEKMEMQMYIRQQIAIQKARTGERQSVESILKQRELEQQSEATRNKRNDAQESPTPPPAGTENL